MISNKQLKQLQTQSYFYLHSVWENPYIPWIKKYRHQYFALCRIYINLLFPRQNIDKNGICNMSRMILILQKSRQVKNAAWIVVCKVIQAALGLVLAMLVARFLGPEDYGLLSYAASITLFVSPIAQLGFTGTIVYELIRTPEQEEEILGTAIFSSLASSLLCMGGIALFIYILHGQESATLLICELYALLLVAQSAELIQYWFQAKLLSKYTSVISLIIYVLLAAYQIYLLVNDGSVFCFALCKGIEHGLIALCLLTIYGKKTRRRLLFSFQCAKKILSRSWYAMVSSLLIFSYAQADRIMIRTMLGDVAVGYYSAAVVCANATDFIFIAIIDSFRPTIMEAKKASANNYEATLVFLYSLIIYMALAQSILISIFAEPIVNIMYGSSYQMAISTLRLIVWYTVFSYVGIARSIWILAEGKQRLWWKINLCGVVLNVILNWRLIPAYGINGAAFASLLTQAFVNVGVGAIFKELRPNDHLMIRAINPWVLLDFLKLQEDEKRNTQT